MRGALVMLAVVIASGCAGPERENDANMMRTIAWPSDWRSFVGKTVTVEGEAIHAKAGAMLAGAGPAIWIDGLDAWPESCRAARAGHGARVRVTGSVIERADLPVLTGDGEPASAGIPVPAGADPEQARRRYLLANATWALVP